MEARREWHEIFKVLKGKKLQPRILYPARLLFRFDGEIKSSTDKQKIKRIQYHQTSFATNAKGTYYFSRQKKATTRNEKLQMEKLTGKGKHIVRERNYLHTNISKPSIVRRGEHKCRTLEMHLKLKDQQLKTILFLYRLLHQNLMVTAN